MEHTDCRSSIVRILTDLSSALANMLTGWKADLYGGQKSILISTRTVVGGKNPFLGIAYIVVGGLCILLGTVFTLTHLVKPRSARIIVSSHVALC